MKKLAIIGANSFQNRLILKAKELGFETHVFAWECGDIGEKTADYFYPISIVEKDEILEKCREISPDGICTIASDLAAITVNYVAEKLGLCCNPTEITEQCTNKYEMRKCFFGHGIKTPAFIKTDKVCKETDNMKYPLIVKPTDRSGSRSITKVYAKEELERAIMSAVNDSFEKQAIVEEYISGEEYSCECISFDGKHTYLAITKKFTTGEPNFIETGHIQPSGLSEDMECRVKDYIFSALDALGIRNGASHSEFRIDENGEINIIEIGARMGGDCIGSDLVFLSTGLDFVKMVIDVACSKAPDLNKAGDKHRAEIRFIFNEDDIFELENIRKNTPEKIYFVSEIERSDKVSDSSTRWGYYIMAEKIPEENYEGNQVKDCDR
ncbi:MAG: ATP-grasp domain-containing protein [Ruminococcaceae bacterium]|nr:ATP-grasp domain-containing protein [Oscillospiraceae bacterium]